MTNHPHNPKAAVNDSRPAWDALRLLVRLSLSIALLILLILTVLAWPVQSLLVDAGLITIAGIAAGIEAWNRYRTRYLRVVITLPRHSLPDHADMPHRRNGHQDGDTPCP